MAVRRAGAAGGGVGHRRRGCWVHLARTDNAAHRVRVTERFMSHTARSCEGGTAGVARRCVTAVAQACSGVSLRPGRCPPRPLGKGESGRTLTGKGLERARPVVPSGAASTAGATSRTTISQSTAAPSAQRTPFAETPMAGHEIPEPADRKQVADPSATPEAAEEARHSCDPAFQHGVVVGLRRLHVQRARPRVRDRHGDRSGSGLIIVHVANRLPTTVWAGCEPPVFVDVPDHRTEVLGLELACAEHLSEVPWILVERGGDICHELEEVGHEYEADAIVVGSTHGLVGADLRLGGGAAGAAGAAAGRGDPVEPGSASPVPIALGVCGSSPVVPREIFSAPTCGL